MAAAATKLTEYGLTVLTAQLVPAHGASTLKYVGWGIADYASADTHTRPTTNGSTNSEVALDLTTETGTRATAAVTQTTTGGGHTNDTMTAIATLTATGSAGTIPVYQACLADTDPIAATTCAIVANFAAINLVAGDSIEFTFNLQFTH